LKARLRWVRETGRLYRRTRSRSLIDVSSSRKVKYGRNFRGLKVQAAELAGAIGVLIYSDPGDDGPVTELAGYKPYPEGPARNPSAVQRGSVQYLSSYPGDPTVRSLLPRINEIQAADTTWRHGAYLQTPGKPAYANATRVEGGNVPRIPSLPISYEDAIPLLELLKGKGIKAADIGSDWEGGLTHRVEYWTGPSEQDLRLVNVQDTRVQPSE
jgi:N-acetylated-alpha-linked acidic dipeptidase